MLGTPAYMPPEQARGESRHADARSDVYSLGVVLYRLLTGRLPFEGDIASVLTQILTHQPTPPRRLNPTIPLDLQTICLKALEKEPADRFTTAHEFAEDLRRWLADEPILSKPPSMVGRLRRWRRRNRTLTRVLTGAAATLLVVSLVLGGVAIYQWQQMKTEQALKEQETRLLAESKAWAALDQARRIVNSPEQGRRFKAQTIILNDVAKHRRDMGADADRERLDLEIQTLLAQTLAVPDVKDSGKDLKSKNLLVKLQPNDQFRDWPVALHPSGKILAIAHSRRPLRWKIGQPFEAPTEPDIPGPRPRIAYSPDGKYLALAPDSGGLRVWDEEKDQEQECFIWPGKEKILAVSFDAAHQVLWTFDAAGTMHRWTLPHFAPLGNDFTTGSNSQFTAAAFDGAA